MSGRVVITNSEDLQLALDAGYTAAQLDIRSPDVSGAIAAAVSAAESRAEAQLAAERAQWAEERRALVHSAMDGMQPEVEASIRKAERTRIADIQALTQRGLETVAARAINEGLSVEAFALAQLREINDRGITMASIVADSPPAAPHAGAPEGGGKGAAPFSPEAAARAYAARKVKA